MTVCTSVPRLPRVCITVCRTVCTVCTNAPVLVSACRPRFTGPAEEVVPGDRGTLSGGLLLEDGFISTKRMCGVMKSKCGAVRATRPKEQEGASHRVHGQASRTAAVSTSRFLIEVIGQHSRSHCTAQKRRHIGPSLCLVRFFSLLFLVPVFVK